MTSPTTALRAPAGTPKVPGAWSQVTIFRNDPLRAVSATPYVSLSVVEANR